MRLLDFAQRLNGRSRTKEISIEERRLAKAHGLVVVYGASDDLMEFEGAIYDEVNARLGGLAWVMDNGTVIDNDSISDEEDEEMSNAAIPTVRSIWKPKEPEGASWLIKTEIPHATFDIYDDENPEQIFCRGIVFALVDALPSSDREQAALLGIDE
jgi:hypothetical protein